MTWTRGCGRSKPLSSFCMAINKNHHQYHSALFLWMAVEFWKICSIMLPKATRNVPLICTARFMSLCIHSEHLLWDVWTLTTPSLGLWQQRDEMSCSGVDPLSCNKSDSYSHSRQRKYTSESGSVCGLGRVYLWVCGFGLDGSQKCNPASNLVRITG